MFNTDCKVAPLAQTAARIIDIFDDVDDEAVRTADGDVKIELEKQCASLALALAEIEAAARSRPATTFEGALFQLMAIRQAAGVLHSAVEPANNDAILKQINAATVSLIRFLETVGGIDRNAVCGEFYAPHSYDRLSMRATVGECAPAT